MTPKKPHHPNKISRKALKSLNAFETYGMKTIFFLRERMHHVILGLIIVVFGIGIYFVWQNHRQDLLLKDWTMIRTAMKLEATSARWEYLEKWLDKMPMPLTSRAQEYAATLLGDYYFKDGRDLVIKEEADQMKNSQKKNTPSAAKDASLEKTPKSDSARKALSWYERARTYAYLDETEKALLQINIGESHELLGNFDQAFSIYKDVFDKNCFMLRAEKDAAKPSGNPDAPSTPQTTPQHQKNAHDLHPVCPYAALQQASLLEKQNKLAKAQEYYQYIQENYKDTGFYEYALGQNRRLQALLLSP